MSQAAFLVRVTDADEADVALAGGADRLGLSDARGPLAADNVAAIVAAVAGRCPISAPLHVLGDGDMAKAANTGIVTIEFSGEAEELARFKSLRARHPVLRGVVTVPDADTSKLGLFAESGFQGAFLRPHGHGNVRLIDKPGIEALSHFVNAAQRRGLAAWIGGALEAPDVPRMLALGPDVLAFRASLCSDGRRNVPLDPVRVAMMRDLIPRSVGDPVASLQTKGSSHAKPNAPDKVFVRDFVVEAGIGAYRYEHRAPQRMRFNVEADLAPIPDTVADMRDVFSYDVIVDAIRLATQRHVLLVERVALDVATATLRDPRVQRVRVRLEKLDILEGAVGVEIERGQKS